MPSSRSRSRAAASTGSATRNRERSRTEADAAASEVKAGARETALAEGKMTPEEFDAAFDATPTEFCTGAAGRVRRVLESLEALGQICDEKFGDCGAELRAVAETVEEVRQTVRILLAKRGAPEAAAPEEPVEEAPAYEESASEAPAAAAARLRRSRGRRWRRTRGSGRRLRARRRPWRGTCARNHQYSPVPYLLLRGLRWGELRVNGSGSRREPCWRRRRRRSARKLKRLAPEGQWEEVLNTAEAAMASPCGRGWLDLQRYVVRACEELGSYYEPIALAVRAELQGAARGLPPAPVADHDRRHADRQPRDAGLARWIPSRPPAAEQQTASAPSRAGSEAGGGAAGAPMPMIWRWRPMRSRRPQEAIEIMSREIAQVRSGPPAVPAQEFSWPRSAWRAGTKPSRFPSWKKSERRLGSGTSRIGRRRTCWRTRWFCCCAV